jgi:AcrR family transcriptional regulator
MRRKRASSLPADERRSMIVDAALPLVLVHGERVTTHEIAKAAGIAEGTIFRVFASKEELLDAVIERALDPAPMEEAIGYIDTSFGLEAAVVEAVKIGQKRVADVWQLISVVGTRFHRPGRHPAPDSLALTKMLERFGDELAVDPATAARVLRSTTFAMTHPMITTKPAPAKQVAHQFLYGVVKTRC